MPDGTTKLTDLLDRMSDEINDEIVEVRDLIEGIGQAGLTALLLMPAIAVVTPLSGIPLFSSFMGTLIFLVAIQMLFRRDHLWVPEWILKRNVSAARVEKAIKQIRPVMAWLDKHLKARLSPFVHRPVVIIPQLLCAASGLVMPLFEVVPFSSTTLGLSVTLLALGMLARDGLYILLGFVPYAALGLLVNSTI